MKEIILLGASGSIGMQSVDVVMQHPHLFHIVALSVGKKISILEEILSKIDCKIVCVQKKEDALILQKKYPSLTIFNGDDGLLNMITNTPCDLLINALVGFVGLRPTLCAIENGIDVALANKETLVAGGQFVKDALLKNHVKLYPIDSEHSAIFQCLQGNQHKEISKLIITASGGSFRDKTRDELQDVTVSEALAHPNWSMGSKITIDSATMMNKGFEVIEAHWLFDLPYSQIETVLHRESIIHSMVQYQDTAIMAQLGSADMRLPIQYAISYPERLPLVSKPLDLTTIGTLHFEPLSLTRYPLLKLAYKMGEKGGNMPAIMNAANEQAVSLFLEGKITFLQIEEAVISACEHLPFIAKPSLDEIFIQDQIARDYVVSLWKGDTV